MQMLSIRIVLPMAMALVTLPLAAALGYAVNAMVDARALNERSNAADHAEATALALDRVIEDTTGLVARIAASEELSRAMPADCRAALRDAPAVMPHYAHAVVSDATGRIQCILPAGASAGPDSVAGLPAFEAMRRHQRLAIGVPFLSPLTRRHVVTVVHPRFDAFGKFLGGVALALDLVRLQSVLDGMQTSASEAQLAVTQDGRVVASSLDAERWVGQDLAGHPLVVRARSGEQGAFEAQGLDGVVRYWSIQTMRSTGWFVLYGKDRDAVLEPYRAARSDAVVLFALGVLAAIGLGLWLSRRIADPIVALADTARSVMAGQPHRAPVPPGPTEVAQVVGLVNEALDARALAQARLAASEQRLRAFIDHLPEVIHVWSAEGRLEFANRRWHDLFNPRGESIRGRPARDFLAPAVAEHVQTEIVEVARTGAAIVRETDLLRGERMQRALVTRFPIFDAHGRVEMVGNIVVDITAQHRLLQALRESEALFATLSDLSPVGIFRTDAQGRTVYANRRLCELTGLDAQRMSGEGWLDAVHPEDRDAAQEAWRQAISLGTSLRRERRLRNVASGVETWVYVEGVPHVSADGVLQGYIGVVIDLTERKRAEELTAEHVERMEAMSRRVLEVQEAERRAIARELHDEVGQALTAVNVSLQGLRSRADAPLAERIDVARQLVDRVIAQIRDTSLNLRPVMLDDLGLVPSLRWLTARVGEASGVDVDLQVSPIGRELPASVATAVFRVVQEALTNVLRYADASVVRVQLAANEDELHVVVEDDGVGFDPGILGERTRRGEVFGLSGLRERLELLGGSLRVHSAPGCGVRMVAVVPLAREAA